MSEDADGVDYVAARVDYVAGRVDNDYVAARVDFQSLLVHVSALARSLPRRY